MYNVHVQLIAIVFKILCAHFPSLQPKSKATCNESAGQLDGVSLKTNTIYGGGWGRIHFRFVEFYSTVV